MPILKENKTPEQELQLLSGTRKRFDSMESMADITPEQGMMAAEIDEPVDYAAQDTQIPSLMAGVSSEEDGKESKFLCFCFHVLVPFNVQYIANTF